MRKRIISIVLLICVIFSLGTSAYAQPSHDAFASKAELLDKLGIIERVTDENEYGEYVTRREFIIAVAKMIGVNIYEVNPNRYYSDMAEDDLAWNAAAVLLERNILTMNDSRTFRPNDIITRDEAACVLVKILGLTSLDYETTLTIAKRCDILDGVSNWEITKADAIKLIHNALCSYMFDYVGMESENFKVKQNGETLMEVCYEMVHIEGIVNSVGSTSITNENGFGENTICIGKTVLSTDIKDLYNYLGKYVSAYYKETEGKEKLQYISVRNNKTEVITIKDDDFAGFDSERYFIECYDGDKIKNIAVDKGANIIWNGKNVSESFKEVLEGFDKGELVLINSDETDEYETVVVNAYEDIVVNYVDTINKIVYGTKGQVIDVNEEHKAVIITDAVGNEKALTDIAKENIISLYASDTMNRLVVSSLTVSGPISALGKKNGNTYVTINRTGYMADKDFMDANSDYIRIGLNGKAYINAYGKMVDFKTLGKTDGIYAWIVNYRVETMFDDTVYLKLFTENNEMVSMALADNVKIDGKRCKNTTEIENALSAENGSVKEQIVIIETDSDNIIRSIDTKADGSMQNGLYVSSPLGAFWYFSGQMVLGPKIQINSSTKLFVVPKSDDYKDDVKSYQVVSGNSFFKDWVSYEVEGYKTGSKDSLGYTEAIVTKIDLSGTVSAQAHANVFVIKGVSEEYDEEYGEIRQQLTLLAGKTEYSYMNADGFSFMTNQVVKEGNVVKINLNSHNEITDITLLYGERKDGTKQKDSNDTVALNQSGWGTKDSYAIGYVTNVENGFVGLSMEKDGEAFIVMTTANKPVTVYDPATKDIVFSGGENDLIDAKNRGYKVVVDISRGNVRSYSVVKVHY